RAARAPPKRRQAGRRLAHDGERITSGSSPAQPRERDRPPLPRGGPGRVQAGTTLGGPGASAQTLSAAIDYLFRKNASSTMSVDSPSTGLPLFWSKFVTVTVI